LTVYSHSRLSSFENCALQYRYRYVDRIRTGFESIEAFMGKRVHEVLENVYENLPRARAAGLDASLALYDRLWSENLTPSVRVVRPDLDVEYYRALGRRCVAGYWERHFPFPIDPDQIIGIELKVEMALDPAGKFRMMGYVDRAQHAGPGVIEIHDYKTTATLPKEGSLRFDRQLPLYEIALRQRFPETKEVRLIWHFLAHAADAFETRTAQELESVRRKCIGLIQTVERAREYPAKKGPLCAWCDYQDVCPEWKGVKPVAPPAFPNGRPAEESGPLADLLRGAARPRESAGAQAMPGEPGASPPALETAEPKPAGRRASGPPAQLPLF
jgi:putative RecB family exonuclease